LFEKLAGIPSQEERALVFNDFMSVKFQLHNWRQQTTDTAKKEHSETATSVSCAADDGFQLGGGGGAQALGGEPHGGRADLPPRPYFGYPQQGVLRLLRGCCQGSARTNAIQSQLDLLYEYCQFELPTNFPM